MNEVVKKEAFEAALAEKAKEMVGDGFGPMVKFDANTREYSLVGGERLDGDRQYAAVCDQYAEGWVKFVDKFPVEKILKKVGEGKLPTREQLADLDLAGKDDDPWVFQRYLPLVDTRTGEVLTFVAKSVGAKIAIGNLLMAYSRNRERGQPIIQLGVGAFRTRDYGARARPDFQIVGWSKEARASDLPSWLDDPDDPGTDDDSDRF
jgi:hypothetical protein